MRTTTPALALLWIAQCLACNLPSPELPPQEPTSDATTDAQDDGAQDTVADLDDATLDAPDDPPDIPDTLALCAELEQQDVHVSAQGDDDTPEVCTQGGGITQEVFCTRDAPCATVSRGLSQVAARAMPQVRVLIQSAPEAYVEPGGILHKTKNKAAITAEVALVGVDETWDELDEDEINQRPTLESGASLRGTLFLSGDRATSMLLRHLIIKGPDLSERAPEQNAAGEVAYTLIASGFSADHPLVLDDVLLVGGRGGPGADGADAPPTRVPSNLDATINGPGQTCAGGPTGGSGGSGGNCDTGALASFGQTIGEASGGGGASKNDCAFVSYLDCADRAGTPGQPGEAGAPGKLAKQGAFASGHGAFSRGIDLSVPRWAPPAHVPSEIGESGKPGAGGGGGSGTYSTTGIFGGGGGGGGCAGGVGQHGKSGGASVVLTLLEASVEVVDAQINYGVGGDGGHGGDASPGALGGAGYRPRSLRCIGSGEAIPGAGGPGGRGGKGADGLPGFGGCVGPVVGILSDQPSPPAIQTLTAAVEGTSGAQGNPVGVGGAILEQCTPSVNLTLRLSTPF